MLTPRTLDEALRLKAERPDARPIQGGTDVMVELNFDRRRPGGAAQPRRGRGAARLGARERHAPPRLRADVHRGDGASSPSCCPRSPRPRAPSARRRSATGARSAATSARPRPPATRSRRSWSRTRRSRSRARAASARCRSPSSCSARSGTRSRPTSWSSRCGSRPTGPPQTFMKVGPRNAMVIAVCSLAVAVDRERGELRAAFGSAGPVPGLVTAPLEARDELPAARRRRARARSTTSAARPPTAATRSRC